MQECNSDGPTEQREEKVRMPGPCHAPGAWAGQGEIKMLSNKWLCVPRPGTMTDWPITEDNEGKPECNFHKGCMDALRIRIWLIKYR